MAGIQGSSVAQEEDSRVTDYTADRRRRSAVAFPIVPLKDVADMARVIGGMGGRCRFDELARQLGQQKSSGAFRGRTAAGRMFGVVATSGSELVLTELGQLLCSGATRLDALVEAFLKVPLYGRLFDRYAAEGGRLPQDKIIEDDMIRLGVPAHNTQRARQVFLRSAGDAGFFSSGRDRLIRPGAGSGTIAVRPSTTPEPRKQAGASHAEAAPMADHPLIHALVAQLPPRGERFTPKQRQRWLDAVKVNLDLIYAEDDEESASASPNGVASARNPVS